MSNMINGNFALTAFHHDVETEVKTTTLEGLVYSSEEKQPMEVVIELREHGFETDISPVLKLDQAEPITFVLMPQSAQMELMEKNAESEVAPIEEEDNDDE